MLHAFGMDHVILRSFDDELAEVQAEDLFRLLRKEFLQLKDLPWEK